MKRRISEALVALLLIAGVAHGVALLVDDAASDGKAQSSRPLIEKITTPIVNWMGDHPYQLLIYSALALFLLLVVLPLFLADIYCSFKLAGLRAVYPNRETRPLDVKAQMARLDFLVQSFDRLLRAAGDMPIIGAVLGKILDKILPKPETTDVTQRPSEVLGLGKDGK